MNGKASRIGIVEVEVAESSTVGEGCKVGCRAPIGADDGGVAAAGKCDVAANADRSLVEGADATSDRIDDVRFDPLDGCGVDIVIAQAVGIGGKPFRKRTDKWLLLCRKTLRVRNPRSGREGGSACCQTQKSSTRELHGISSILDMPGRDRYARLCTGIHVIATSKTKDVGVNAWQYDPRSGPSPAPRRRR